MKKPATATRRNGTVHCAIYTRKSSEEGLDQEFNSLQAQREACEAFITSQRQEGWLCLRAAYDDGGFSGATTHQSSTGVSRGPQRSASTGPSCRWPASALSSPR